MTAAWSTELRAAGGWRCGRRRVDSMREETLSVFFFPSPLWWQSRVITCNDEGSSWYRFSPSVEKPGNLWRSRSGAPSEIAGKIKSDSR